MDKSTWVIYEVNKDWGHHKFALYATQYATTSFKGQTTACAKCTTFASAATMANLEVKE